MTLLEKAISKNALAKIDIFRRQRGIRTRRDALEKLLEEAIPEHPLTTKLRLAKDNPVYEEAPLEAQEAVREWRENRAQTIGLHDFLTKLKEN
jgi:hypothetical protein